MRDNFLTLFRVSSVVLIFGFSAMVAAKESRKFTTEGSGDFPPGSAASADVSKQDSKRADIPPTNVNKPAPAVAAPGPQPPAETPALAEKTKASVKGRFVMTRIGCSYLAEPAETAKVVASVRAEKKLWVEDRNEKFYSAFDKTGKEIFISKDCLARGANP